MSLAVQMAEPVKALATNPDHLSLSPSIHMVGDQPLLKVPARTTLLTSTYTRAHTHSEV